MDDPVVAIRLFPNPLPATLRTRCGRHFQKAILVVFNLLVNYRLCGPLATALSNLHGRDKVSAVIPPPVAVGGRPRHARSH